MTKWDGGLFNIRLVFPTAFPTHLPRIRFVTPFFHANVSPDGIPYYRVHRSDQCQSYIDALIDLFEKDMNPDPSCVLDRRCARMYWRDEMGGKKEYSRLLRRAVTRSVEYV
jgi:ubiquitin-conjugating enzyme E2 Z